MSQVDPEQSIPPHSPFLERAGDKLAIAGDKLVATLAAPMFQLGSFIFRNPSGDGNIAGGIVMCTLGWPVTIACAAAFGPLYLAYHKAIDVDGAKHREDARYWLDRRDRAYAQRLKRS